MDLLLTVINSCLETLAGEPKRVTLSSATSLKDVYGMGRGDLKRTKEVYTWRDTRWLSIEEAAKEFERAGIDEYNEFTPNSIRALGRIYPKFEVNLAREGSPCVYLRVPTSDKSRSSSSLDDLVEKIKDSRAVGADEVSAVEITGDRSMERDLIRVWWD